LSNPTLRRDQPLPQRGASSAPEEANFGSARYPRRNNFDLGMMADAALVDGGGTSWLQNGHSCRSSHEPNGSLMRLTLGTRRAYPTACSRLPIERQYYAPDCRRLQNSPVSPTMLQLEGMCPTAVRCLP